MKSLYEATNGWTGESYIRCYVWADSPDEALDLARGEFKRDVVADRYPEEYSHNVSVRLLFSADAPTFVTSVSGDGFGYE